MKRVLLWALMVVVVVAPLPLGSNRPIPWTLLALAIALLLLAWSAVAAVRPGGAMVTLDRLVPPLLGVGLVLVVVVLQVLPGLPTGWLHPIWVQATPVLGADIAGRITLDVFATGTATMRLLTYAGVFWLALQLGRMHHGAARIIQAIAFAGLGYAVYGLVAHLLLPDTLLWWRKWTWMTGVSGPFVNRNSYATYAGLGLICAFGLLAATMTGDASNAHRGGRSWRRRLLRLSAHAAWLLTAVVVITLALVLSQSRAGVTASALGMVVLLAGFGITRQASPRVIQVAVGAAVAIGVGAFALAGDDLAGRVALKGVADQTRAAVYQQIAGAIGNAPWLGTGYGTFGEGFRSYQQGVMAVYWDQAHNTYLENAFELGIPAALALVVAIAWIGFRCARSLLAGHHDALYPCLAVAATALVGSHALFDFSLEMPAVAVTYAAILGVGFGRVHGHATEAGKPEGDHAGGRAAWRSRRHQPCLAVALVVGLVLAALAVPRGIAHLSGLPAELAARRLEANNPPPIRVLEQAIGSAKRAARWADASRNWWHVGVLELTLAERARAVPNAYRSRLQEAERALRRSLARAPANGAAWAQLAFAVMSQDGPPKVVGDALALSVVTAPHEGNLLPFRTTVAALAWPTLDQRTRALFQRQFQYTMTFAPQQFVNAIRQSEAGVEVVRTRLADDPGLQASFDRILLLLGKR